MEPHGGLGPAEDNGLQEAPTGTLAKCCCCGVGSGREAISGSEIRMNETLLQVHRLEVC